VCQKCEITFSLLFFKLEAKNSTGVSKIYDLGKNINKINNPKIIQFPQHRTWILSFFPSLRQYFLWFIVMMTCHFLWYTGQLPQLGPVLYFFWYPVYNKKTNKNHVPCSAFLHTPCTKKAWHGTASPVVLFFDTRCPTKRSVPGLVLLKSRSRMVIRGFTQLDFLNH
jgi:hypothetical protein